MVLQPRMVALRSHHLESRVAVAVVGRRQTWATAYNGEESLVFAERRRELEGGG